MKASIALRGGILEDRLTANDEVRIQTAVAKGLVEGIIRLVLLVVFVPAWTVVFVIVCFMFPGGTSDPTPWFFGLSLFLIVPVLVGRVARWIAA